MGNSTDIAIVGMSVHVPGAESLDVYWANLRSGTNSIRRLTEKQLLEAGESPQNLARSNYVPASAKLDGYDMFDADFFGFSPKEAAIMDPQHRIFLEVAWEALENAGHPPGQHEKKIGVYAGCGMGSYFYFNICSNPNLVDDVGMFLLRHTGNDKDFLSTRVSHVFDLKGPSINLQTACSTSLVAVHYARQALLSGECDMALAGGATIEFPHGRGYLYQENEILSPDGQCHAFDHRAQGTVFGSGAGAVVLRRLSDAIADGDHIWAVIKGSAVNNDGAAKAGYLAPSVTGQAEAIAAAHADAGISSETVGYVECHGTGTYLGDPIEVSALTEAFRQTTEATDFCRIGSVKTNIGHLDTAAGVASLAKTALSLHHKEIPPSLGYEAANPVIDFDNSPFRVNAELSDWPGAKSPRRAGVNSLGVGGTNAHLVLEEAPELPASQESDWPFQILTLSAKSKAALDAGRRKLADHLRANPNQPLGDIAFTLKEGRQGFEHRCILVAHDHIEAAELLESGNPHRVFTHRRIGDDAPGVVFMFPGGGAQYPAMARDLYETEPVFAEWMDRGLDHLQPKLDYDLRALWLNDDEAATQTLKQPSVQLPLIMVVEHALAQLWMSWGVKPTALVGHSMGENTAACLAGVLSFEDCIDLVLLRGRLFDQIRSGGMLSVPLAVADLTSSLDDDLDIAAINAPDLTVVSGPQDALDRLDRTLQTQDIRCQRVPIDVAAHSRMLDPILAQFRDFLAGLTLKTPEIPLLSNRTGQYLTAAQATDPDYWVEHLRHMVQFGDCMGTLAAQDTFVYLEVGPGKALSSLAQMQQGITSNQVLSSLRHPDQKIADDVYFLGVIGRLWATGVQVDWSQIWGEARRRRVPLPTYAFQRARYFIEPGIARAEPDTAPLKRQDAISQWGYRRVWREAPSTVDLDIDPGIADRPAQNWLIFVDETGLCDQIVRTINAANHNVTTVRIGDTFRAMGQSEFTLAPELGRAGYDQLIAELVARDRVPDRVVHAWLVTDKETHRPGSSFFIRNQECGFQSLAFLGQSIGDAGLTKPIHVTVLTSEAASVRSEPLAYPERAMIAGPAGVLPREIPGLTFSTLDIDIPSGAPQAPSLTSWLRKVPGTRWDPALIRGIFEELLSPTGNTTAALRNGRRFSPDVQRLELAEIIGSSFKDGATYLITGGLGGLGLSVAEYLVRNHHAKVVLVSRRALPDRSEWPAHLRRTPTQNPVSKRIRAIQRLESLGGQVMVAAADVCDLDEMRSVIEAAGNQFGEITGVIHAAGAIDDAPVLTKSHFSMERVLAPKVQGLRILDRLFADGKLEQLILFSSTSTETRPAGQIDYVAANEYLNAFAEHRRGGATRVTTINWGVWAEVGMAAKAIGTKVENGETAPLDPTGQPLLQHGIFDGAGNRVFVAELSATRCWVLNEHRTAQGQAVLPGTGYLELAAEALRGQGHIGAFEISDIAFLSPLGVDDATPREIHVRLTESKNGYEFETLSAIESGGRRGFQKHAKGRIAPASHTQTVQPAIDIEAIKLRTVAPDDSDPRSPQEAHMNFGPRWQVLRSQRFGRAEGLAHLALPEVASGDLGDGYLLHPALLDLATGWAIELADDYSDASLWVPAAYHSVVVYTPLPKEIYSWVRNGEENHPGFASFDVTLCDADGIVCIDIRGFTMRRLDDAARFASATKIDAHLVEYEGAQAPNAPASAAEERLAFQVSLGIRPGEGAEALERALAQDLPVVIVSSIDLPALIKEVGQSAAGEPQPGQRFDRPNVDSDFVAPDTATEKDLATIWQDLLGVSEVGVEDSFFDLGGHSLIAVRLFAAIRRSLQVDFPLSVLFDAPTIRKLAELIEARTGVRDLTAPEAIDTSRRFTHLVAMHEGAGGPGAPLFVVAGMFGNVLNLRHLAQHLGNDRPFYGLQARGLLGDAQPHNSIPEAAAACITEIKQVQPDGPYYLGGFSGGGITAYEIAQQLHAAGDEVAMLAMLDTPLPVRPALTRRDKALIKTSELRRNGVRYLGKWVRNRIRWEQEKRTLRAEDVNQLDPSHYHDRAIEAAFRTAVANYELAQWHGPLCLFRPPLDRHWSVSGDRWVSTAREYVFDDNEWTKWAPAIEVIEVPGDHDSMVLEPNVRALARRLKTCIQAAEPSALSDDSHAMPWARLTAAE